MVNNVLQWLTVDNNNRHTRTKGDKMETIIIIVTSVAGAVVGHVASRPKAKKSKKSASKWKLRAASHNHASLHRDRRFK